MIDSTAGSPFSLKGKVVLVTGSSRGIGAEAAKLLADHGARVIVSSRRLLACEEIAKQINAGGGDARAMACHIGDLQQIEDLHRRIDEEFGRLDVLVNNAATNPYFGPILDTPVEAFNKTVEVNIRGYFYSSLAAARRMRAQGGGSIINIASVNGIRPAPMQGVYSVTKAAVIGLTRALARELGPLNIRVNAVLPGLTDTNFASTIVDDASSRERFLVDVPLGRTAQPSDIAGTILYLASPASSYTTGSCVAVDGGYLA